VTWNLECDNNKAISSYGFLNTYESKAIVIKDSKIYDNSVVHVLSPIEKETVKIENAVFKNNHFYEGGYYNSIIDDIFMWQGPTEQLPSTQNDQYQLNLR
jgi:hypothetical protein